jgi:hypothetical protein
MVSRRAFLSLAAIQDYDMSQRRLMHRTTMGGAVPRSSRATRTGLAAWLECRC